MIYGYIRVSTVKQASEGNSLEGQKKLLLENGVKEENIYKDIYNYPILNISSFYHPCRYYKYKSGHDIKKCTNGIISYMFGSLAA